MISIIGDVHGKIDEYRKILADCPGPSIQIGDMGYGFPKVHLPHLPLIHTWFRGNHDNPSMCQHHPNYMGDWGYLPTYHLLWLGGAWSIDSKYRVEDVSWWRDEELSIGVLNRVWNIYAAVKPRFVLSHEAPIAAAEFMVDCPAPSSHEANPTTISKSPQQKEEYKVFKNGLGCARTRTSQALQSMLEVHAPEEWVFGHYHHSTSFRLNNYPTKFTCVGELAVYNLQTERK